MLRGASPRVAPDWRSILTPDRSGQDEVEDEGKREDAKDAEEVEESDDEDTAENEYELIGSMKGSGEIDEEDDACVNDPGDPLMTVTPFAHPTIS